MALPLQFTVGFIYLLELAPRSYHARIATTQNILATFTVVFCAIYFAFVSKDWFYYVLAGLLMQLVQLSTIWFLPESPRQLLAFGHTELAITAFKRIGKINGADTTGISDSFKDHYIVTT